MNLLLARADSPYRASVYVCVSKPLSRKNCLLKSKSSLHSLELNFLATMGVGVECQRKGVEQQTIMD